jgi:hypothetical protein
MRIEKTLFYALQAPQMGGKKLEYLIRDEFLGDLAAGAVHGTPATPGPGTRSLVDAGARVSLSAGAARFALGGGTADPRLTYEGITAVAGLCFAATVRQNEDAAENVLIRAGWDAAQTGAIDAESINFNAAGVLAARWGSSSTQNVGNYARLTDYKIAIVYLPTQTRWFIRGGAYADWTQLHSQAQARVSGGTTLYPAINAYNRLAAFGSVKVALLPKPFDSDEMTLNAAAKKLLDSL